MAIFDLAEHRLSWIERRQAVLAQNVANASTPGYVAKDLQPFDKALAGATSGLSTTQPGHLLGVTSSSQLDRRHHASERAPDGNAVSLDDQLTKIADTDQAQALAINLYHAYLGMFRSAIGR